MIYKSEIKWLFEVTGLYPTHWWSQVLKLGMESTWQRKCHEIYQVIKNPWCIFYFYLTSKQKEDEISKKVHICYLIFKINTQEKYSFRWSTGIDTVYKIKSHYFWKMFRERGCSLTWFPGKAKPEPWHKTLPHWTICRSYIRKDQCTYFSALLCVKVLSPRAIS